MDIQKICTLCLEKCRNFKYVEGNTKNILDLFLPEMDFTIIQEPVMCENCEEMLAKCLDFKATCLYTHDYLVPFVDNKDAAKLDLKDVYLSKNITVTGVPEDRDICVFCMELVKNSFATALDVEDEEYVLQKMIEQCLPELDLSVIKKPVICADCHGSLESCFRFVTNCLTIEEKIKQYHENLDINSKGQIELSGLIYSTIGSVKTSDIDSNSVDITKVKKQVFARGNPEKSEMVSGVNDIELEQMPRVNENFDVRIENKNESFMALDIPKVNNGQQWSPKNILVLEEESNELSAIKIEQTLFEETKHTDETLGDIEDKKCLLNEEIEIKTDKDDLNRCEKSIVTTQPKATTSLSEKRECILPNLKGELPKSHMEQTFIRRPTKTMHQCERCSFKTKKKRDLKIHALVHKAPRQDIYKCNSCTYQARRKIYLKRHLLTHKDVSEVTMYKCDFCAYQGKFKKYLQKHMLTHKYPTEVAMYKCDSCIYQTEYKDFFKNHLRKHEDSTVYKCTHCTYRTYNKTIFDTHLLSHPPPDTTMYKCESCLYWTKRKDYLEKHLLKHKNTSEVTMYRCASCSYQTKYKCSLQRHMEKHKSPSEVTIYKCESCAYRTKWKVYIDAHLLMHKDPSRPVLYQCDSCTYQTKHKRYLRIHLLKYKTSSEVEMYSRASCFYQTRREDNLEARVEKQNGPSE